MKERSAYDRRMANMLSPEVPGAEQSPGRKQGLRKLDDLHLAGRKQQHDLSRLQLRV